MVLVWLFVYSKLVVYKLDGKIEVIGSTNWVSVCMILSLEWFIFFGLLAKGCGYLTNFNSKKSLFPKYLLYYYSFSTSNISSLNKYKPPKLINSYRF